MPLRFNILGPIEIRCGAKRIDVRGAQQRTFLVTLLVSAGKLVLIESIMNEIWGGVPPYRVENALHAHVSRLRYKLATVRSCGVPEITNWPSGYRLDMTDECELDAAILTSSLSEVQNTEGMPADEATARLRSALSLWRGPVFGGPLGGPICRTAAARYAQTRLSALSLLYDLELKRGRHAEIIDELTELTNSEDLNERLCEQLMVALYRDGRQADALAVYRKMWERLNDQLGVDASPSLRRYEHAILIQDPRLLQPEGFRALRG
jgi:SARP family transcriptional regulator, regulator of embCAB operon